MGIGLGWSEVQSQGRSYKLEFGFRAFEEAAWGSLGAWKGWGSDLGEVGIGKGSDPWTLDGLGFEFGGFEWARVRIQGARMGWGPDVRTVLGSVGAGPVLSTHQPAGLPPVLPGE